MLRNSGSQYISAAVAADSLSHNGGEGQGEGGWQRSYRVGLPTKTALVIYRFPSPFSNCVKR